MSVSPFTWGTRVLALGALLFGLFLAGGWLLPGTWAATASREMAAPPDSVFGWVDSPARWSGWTSWPDEWLRTEGPERGVGARMTWDHPEMGDGVFEIVAVEPGRSVRYEVLVEEGSLRTEGRIALAPVAGGTRVTWTEEGDFGWNPLMGYWALAMERVQGRELQKGLDRLEARVRGEGAEAPAPATEAPPAEAPPS